MRCQMMAGRAAKSPPDWLLYLPPDPSLPWAVAGEEQGKIYTWLGVRTGKHAGIKAPGVWPGHSGPPLLQLPWGWKVPQPMGQPRWQEDQRNLIVQPTESGTVAGNTCRSWNTAISLPHLFPSLGLNHSCLCDYTACACPRDCGGCSQALGLVLLSNSARQALSPLQEAMPQPTSQHRTSSWGTHGKWPLHPLQ